MRFGRSHRRTPRARRVTTALLVPALAVTGGCRASSTASSGSTTLSVTVAENFWGSIVTQLAGSKARVTSVIVNPSTDPHDYEPTAQNTRDIAAANYVVYNGIGYDTWAKKAIDANPSSGRAVLAIGKLLHLKDGDNPHQWYSPESVRRVIEQVASDLAHLDPKDAVYFDQQKTAFETNGLHQYYDAIREIRTKYATAPVGASESIFAPLARSLGLNLLTPASFLDAIAEGTDPTAADKATVDAQIADKKIRVFVFNAQNSTPDVRRLVNEARARNIPVTSVTETLTPANVSFQDWQSTQLERLRSALATGTGS